MRSIAQKINTRKQLWILPVYGLIYMLAFRFLEKNIAAPGSFHLIHCPLDDRIPFVEFFVIFYLSWFIYMTLAYGFFMFVNKDAREFHLMFALTSIGMTIFLITSAVWPNGLDIRPTTFPRDNVFVTLVKYLYSKDTPTNVFPSIHVFNSLAVYLSARSCRMLQSHRIVYRITGIWALLIILSTAFVKQHSLYDIFAGIILCLVLYMILYRPWKQK